MTQFLLHPLLRLLAFIVAFGLLVTVHEFGHFWVARRLGFKVLRFSVGFGRPLVRWIVGRDRFELVIAAVPLVGFGKALWKRLGADGTEYCIAAFPIGGYVKMLDEREGEVAPADLPRSFTRRPHWQRLLVLLAGPAFNIVSAVLLLTGLLYVSGVTQARPVLGPIDAGTIFGQAGLKSGDEIIAIDSRPVSAQNQVQLDLLDALSSSGPITIGVRAPNGAERTVQLPIPSAAERRRLTAPAAMSTGLGLAFYEPPIPAVVAAVEPNEPAARAGLAAGDRIVAVDGIPVHDFVQFQKYVQSHPGDRLSISYRRGTQEATVQLTTLAENQNGRRIGGIGIQVSARTPYPASMLRHLKLSLPAAFGRATVEAWDMTALQGRMIWRMLANKVSIKNLSGPLSIAEYAGDAAAAGLGSFLYFLVILSLMLGFMNLLPIPILDGGQVLFQAIEWLKGDPLSERVQVIGQQLGVALLVLLMGVALFNDISQFG
jgi:regulator of sigma E protease